MHIQESPKSRNYKIDTLRAIGTLLVILAHTSIPTLFSHIRTFDVVMLVWISGYSFAISYSKKRTSYKSYILKRFTKLIIPVYILITFLFLASYFVCLLLSREQLYSTSKILFSYIFDSRGIGYIWIAKVYFIIALISYLLWEFNDRISSNIVFFVFLTVALIFYQFLISFDVIRNSYFVREYMVYLIPYGCIALFGIRCYNNVQCYKIGIIYFAVLFALTQITMLFTKNSFAPGDFKYPPQIYYLSYGMLFGMLLYFVLPNKKLNCVTWFSYNSFSIYLFHIVNLLIYSVLTQLLDIKLLSSWYIEYPIIILSSVIETFLFNATKKCFLEKIYAKTKIKKQ